MFTENRVSQLHSCVFISGHLALWKIEGKFRVKLHKIFADSGESLAVRQGDGSVKKMTMIWMVIVAMIRATHESLHGKVQWITPCISFIKYLTWQQNVTSLGSFASKREEKQRQTINYINFMLSAKSVHKEKLFSSLIASQLARNVRQITCSRWELIGKLQTRHRLIIAEQFSPCLSTCRDDEFIALLQPFPSTHDISSPINCASVECFPLYLAQIAQSAASD